MEKEHPCIVITSLHRRHKITVFNYLNATLFVPTIPRHARTPTHTHTAYSTILVVTRHRWPRSAGGVGGTRRRRYVWPLHERCHRCWLRVGCERVCVRACKGKQRGEVSTFFFTVIDDKILCRALYLLRPRLWTTISNTVQRLRIAFIRLLFFVVFFYDY